MPKQHLGQIGSYWLSRRPGSDSYCRTWFDRRTRQTKRASLGTNDLQEAQIKLAEWVVNNQVLRKEDPKDLPLETVLIRYYNNHAVNLRSAESARYHMEKWSDFFAAQTVSDLTEIRLKEFMTQLSAKGYSDGYIGRILRTGKAALNRAYRSGEIASVPYVPSGSKGIERTRILTLDETAALFNAVKSDHVFMYLMLAFNTLARPEAILELKRFQVNTEHRFIELNPPGRKETKKRRPTLPITNTLFPWVEKVKTDCLVTWKGKQIKSIKKAFRMVRNRAKLDKSVIPYTIRHTMATELRKRGVEAWELSGYLGHSFGKSTTERYAKYSPDYMSNAVKAIDEYFIELQPLVDRTLVFNKHQRVKSVLAGDKPES